MTNGTSQLSNRLIDESHRNTIMALELLSKAIQAENIGQRAGLVFEGLVFVNHHGLHIKDWDLMYRLAGVKRPDVTLDPICSGVDLGSVLEQSSAV